MIPRLPPKQLMLDAFLEERRCGLQRWLFLVNQHPVLSKDEMLKIFMSERSLDYLKLIEDAALIASNVCATDTEISDNLDASEINVKCEKIRILNNRILVVKRLIEQQLQRNISQAKDFAELSGVLSDLMPDDSVKDFSENFLKISDESAKNYINERIATIERINLLLDILVSFSDMCDRITSQIEERKNYQNNQKTGFINRDKIASLIKSSIGISEKSSLNVENIKRQNFIDIKCANEEYQFAQKYLQLLPSILLHFSYEEGKSFAEVSKIFNRIIDIESGKLN
jgi:PX domain